jgi:hypothetical protein
LAPRWFSGKDDGSDALHPTAQPKDGADDSHYQDGVSVSYSEENGQVVLRTYGEGFAALDVLHHATEYITAQYSDLMTRPQAQAHFEARELLFRRGMALLDEMELAYFYEDQV